MYNNKYITNFFIYKKKKFISHQIKMKIETKKYFYYRIIHLIIYYLLFSRLIIIQNNVENVESFNQIISNRVNKKKMC